MLLLGAWTVLIVRNAIIQQYQSGLRTRKRVPIGRGLRVRIAPFILVHKMMADRRSFLRHVFGGIWKNVIDLFLSSSIFRKPPSGVAEE
jgi:hypothetical protein